MRSVVEPGRPNADHRPAGGESPSVSARTVIDCVREPVASEWNDFIADCPRGNFYLRHEWFSVNRNEFGHDVLCFQARVGGELTGVFPLVRVRSRLFGDMLVSMPFVNLGGPAARDLETERLLVEACHEMARELRCDHVEIRVDRALGDLPVATHKVSMTVELPDDPDALWESFSRKHRKNIRSVTSKADIEVSSGGAEFIGQFYSLMERSWRDLGTPLYRRRYFEEIVRSFGDDLRIFVASIHDRPVAAAMVGLFGDTVEGTWAAVDPRARNLQPNYVLYWEMLKYASAHGFRRFHLGRSTIGSGAEQFKAKWGAEPQQLYWNYLLVKNREIPALRPDNPKFQLAIRSWRRLPLGVVRLLGPGLARSIP